MINVTDDQARVNILDVEKCKKIFLNMWSKVNHIKSNLFYVYVSIRTPHPTDGNLTVPCSVFLLFWVLTELR